MALPSMPLEELTTADALLQGRSQAGNRHQTSAGWRSRAAEALLGDVVHRPLANIARYSTTVHVGAFGLRRAETGVAVLLGYGTR